MTREKHTCHSKSRAYRSLRAEGWVQLARLEGGTRRRPLGDQAEAERAARDPAPAGALGRQGRAGVGLHFAPVRWCGKPVSIITRQPGIAE